MRGDEIERSWEVMGPFLTATEAADAPRPEEYPIGGDGPAGADKLLAQDGRKWQKIG
jgi:glucose-6-phosphate 1-dehydrogenase